MRELFIYVIFVIWLQTVSADTCVYEICFCDGAEIMCQERGLTEIPPISGPSPDKGYLIIDSNNITSLPAGSLPKNLETLSAFNNPTDTIDDDTFKDSNQTLENLSFSQFRFRQIPNAFKNLNALKYLTLYDSLIEDWNLDVMSKIGTKMVILDLRNVGLVTWPSWLQNFTNLTELTVDGGGLSSIPDNALDMLANTLTSLSISNNSLTVIPKTISNLKVLQSLQLQDNKITNITWLPQSSGLRTIALGYNSISDANHLSDSLRPFSESLYDVRLLGNDLTKIPDLSFLTKLNKLDFSYNRISESTDGSLPEYLYELNLANNFLTKIPNVYIRLLNVIEWLLSNNLIREINAVDFSPSVNVLDISFNQITELTDTSFPPNCSISTLNLMNNPLSRISSHAFDNLPHLNVLVLRNSKLSRLPLGLASLRSINFFDINESSDLICTCMEKSLAPWILTQPTNFPGNCGEDSIHDFFTNLIPTCP